MVYRLLLINLLTPPCFTGLFMDNDNINWVVCPLSTIKCL